MQSKTNKSFTSLLQEIPDLCKFVKKVNQLEQIHYTIAKKLEPSLSAHCQVANLRDGTLILATTSPAWNHKLRFASMDLLSSLRTDRRWSGLKSIEIRVDYLSQKQNTSPIKSHKSLNISRKNAECLLEAATNISDQKLAKALQKLAALSNERNTS